MSLITTVVVSIALVTNGAKHKSATIKILFFPKYDLSMGTVLKRSGMVRILITRYKQTGNYLLSLLNLYRKTGFETEIIYYTVIKKNENMEMDTFIKLPPRRGTIYEVPLLTETSPCIARGGGQETLQQHEVAIFLSEL